MNRTCGRDLAWLVRAWAAALATLLALGGCATPAKMDQMVPNEHEAPAAPSNSMLRGAVAIERVGGGEAPDPMMVYSAVGAKELEGALREALGKFGYLSPDANDAPYRLQAFLVDMRRPGVGITMVATSLIRYKLVRARDASVLYDDIVTASARKTGSDAFVGAERHRMAVEGSIRANIAQFLANLYSSDFEKRGR